MCEQGEIFKKKAKCLILLWVDDDYYGAGATKLV